MKADQLLIHSDSQLVTQQLLGTYERKEERMMAYASQTEELIKKFHKVDIVQIPREENVQADMLSPYS